jgi:beta-lactamase superfamily II metal-dependent hydrolase
MAAMKKNSSSSGKLRIRMYSIGFGDCFLLTFPGEKHVLIDCGVHMHSKLKRTTEVVEHIREVTDGKLAAVVATHAHADHISGFATEAELFDEFEVKEVWLSWLEDVSKASVRKLHKKVQALTTSIANSLAVERDEMTESLLANATGELAASPDGPNARAMRLLRGGFGNKKNVRYLTAGDELCEPAGIEGLTVRVLAPAKETEFISRMDPPSEQEYKLRATGDTTKAREPFVPFASEHVLDTGVLEPNYVEGLHEIAKFNTADLALFVDHYLNNTSLSLLLEHNGKTLLFPGDAQWGNWQSWQAEWDDILGDICFYKVGHHGSHNATPSKAMSKMRNAKLVAMVPTDYVKKFREANHEVPYTKLITKLGTQTNQRFVRSDDLDDAPAPFEKGEFWCDYKL